MKSYSPFLIRTISPKIAQGWINQAEEIITCIEKRFAATSSSVDDNQKLIYEECPKNKLL